MIGFKMSVNTKLSSINENPSITKQDLSESVESNIENNHVSSMSKETKSKSVISFSNKSSCYCKNMKPPNSKRKCVPAASCLTDSSVKVMLSERNVQIKDLESKVKFQQSKIKELENEKKTLLIVQSRQGRELKKFKESITDIPALLKSHKEEIKVYESTISNIRKELREHQKEVKLRNESLLKKENQIIKLNINLKQNDKLIQEFSSEIKMLKAAKKDLEEKNKNLSEINANLKNENDDLHQQIKDLIHKIQNLEENLNKEKDLNKNRENELCELKLQCENKFLQVSSDKGIQDSENQISCDAANDVPQNGLIENSHEDFIKNKIEKLDHPVMDTADEQKECSSKLVDKIKAALIHSFNAYQPLCDSNLNTLNFKLFETGPSNVKVLPPLPLKLPSKESSTSIITDFGMKEYFSSQINFVERNENQTKDFQSEFTTINYEEDKSENKAIALLDSSAREKNSILDLLHKDDIKHRQNLEFQKDIPYTERFYKTDNCIVKTPQNSSFITKDNTDAKNHVTVSKALKTHDYLQCRNSIQKKLKTENNSLDEILDRDSSENRSKYLKNMMKPIDFDSKIDEYKGDKLKHRSNLLKQTNSVKGKPLFYFDKLYPQKRLETWLDDM